MRLTLRTLLAYLDDTLEPAAAREIGQKLAESPGGQELVSRIKEVTRRRRLVAPPLTGDEVDPNLLAEYLDNLLSAEETADIERICLDSDVHLAEAAACHQILTLIGQPAQVPRASRQRMYDLVHAMESIPVSQRRFAKQPPVPPALMPSMFSGRPLLARVLSAAAVIVGAVVIGGLIWINLTMSNSRGNLAGTPEVAEKPQGELVEGIFKPAQLEPKDSGASLPELPAAAPPDPQAEPTGEATATESEPVSKMEPPPVETSPSETKPMEELSEGPNPDVKPDPQSTPTTPEAVAAEPVAAEPTTVTEPVPEKPAVEAPVPVGQYASTSGILMHADPAHRQEWRRLPHRSVIQAEQPLLSLPTYRAAAQLDSGVAVELVGEAELKFLVPDEGVDARLQLDRGNIVLGTTKAGGTLQVEFMGQTWRITIHRPETIAALSLTSRWNPGRPSSHEAVLYVPNGEVDLQSGMRLDNLGGPVQVRWTPDAGMGDREPLSTLPGWIQQVELGVLAQRASEQLDRSIRENESPVLRLVELVSDDRRENRLLAVQCLGAIGRLPALVDAMNALEQRDVRQEAIRALRQYMARGPAQEAALEEALHQNLKKLTDRGASGVLGLLRGFSDAEFRERDTYDALIKLLSAPELSIRELAISNLEELAGRPFNVHYSPDNPSEASLNAWRRALDEGRFPPKARGKL